MIELKNALQIARDYYYNKGQQEITKIYEADENWIVYGGIKGQSKIGGVGITIDKEDGHIGSFLLPSKENFAILRSATLIEIEV